VTFLTSLPPLLLIATAAGEVSGDNGRPEPPEAESPAKSASDTVTARFDLLPKEEGQFPFNGVSIKTGVLAISVTVAGAGTVAIIDLSTDRSLVDIGLARQQGIEVGEPLDTIEWHGKTHERRRAHAVEVVLDGQARITSDLSAIDLTRARGAAPGSIGYVLGRSALNYVSLLVVLNRDEHFYGLARSGSWKMSSDTAAIADLPYADGVVTVEVNGTPLRLFVDFTSRTGIELVPEGWTKLYGSAETAPLGVTFGPFTRDVQPRVLFEPPPVENIDGVIGLGFIDGFALVLDGPQETARIMGTAMPSAPEAPAD